MSSWAGSMARAPRTSRRLVYFLEAPLRRRSLVLAPVLLLSVVAAAIAHLLPPRYRAAALLRAEWSATHEALLQKREIDVAARRTRAVRQHATERNLLERVAREASPYGPVVAGPSLDEALDRLLSDLRVRPMSTSSFVIEFVHRDPAMAARVPSAVARQLADADSDAKRAGQEAAHVEARVEQARLVLKQKADALGRNMPSATEPNDDDVDAPPADEQAFAEARLVAASLATARSRADRLRQTIEADARVGPAGPPTPQQELELLRARLGELRQRYTEEHPDVERLRRQIVRLEASLPLVPPGPPSPQEELRATESEIETLLARKAELEARTSPPFRSQPRRRAVSPALDSARQQAVLEHERAQQAYQTLLEEWQAASAARPSSPAPIVRFELMREAAIPQTPESPSPVLFVLAGALAGLVTGLVATVVSEHRDQRVKGPEDLEGILPVPVLATLPDLQTRGRR